MNSVPQIGLNMILLELAAKGYIYELPNAKIVFHHFTRDRYAQTIYSKMCQQKTTADAIFNNYIVHYCLAQYIHSDQGGKFENRFLPELCDLTVIKK
jgi:hypothetical protein